MHEVVVTGYSVASPLGNTISQFTERMFMGESGVTAIRGTVVDENFPVPYAALLSDTLGLPSVGENQSGTEMKMIVSSLFGETLRGFPPGETVDGMIFGTAQGCPHLTSLLASIRAKTVLEQDPNDFFSDLPLSYLKEIFDTEIIFEYNTCITGASVVGHAMQRIRSGRWQRAVVAAVEPRVRPWQLMALQQLGALSTAAVPPQTASRPFSKSRCGFVKGEGAGMMLLESREAAERRGAPILGAIAGYAQTSDQWRLTDGREDGKGVIHAIHGALRDGQVENSHIGYINAHGTSTPMNDKLETQAIKSVFGDRAYKIPVSSLKSQIGHSNIACGMIEAIATLIMLQKQKVAPTINYFEPDPECDLDYVPNTARDLKFDYALSNSFGFGGANACLLLKGS